MLGDQAPSRKREFMSGYRIHPQLILMATLMLSGCIFHDYDTPAVEGTLTERGQPLSGVRVFLESGSWRQETRTDSQGHFAFPGQGSWKVFIPVGPQDRMSRWSVLIARPSGEITAYKEGGIGGPFSGYSRSDSVRLTCDLARADEKNQMAAPGAVCR